MSTNIVAGTVRTQQVCGLIETALRVQPSTMVEIAEAIGMTLKSAQTYVGFLRKHNQMHIVEYRCFRTAHGLIRKTPIYAIGPGVDAVKPKNGLNALIEQERVKAGHEPVVIEEEFVPRCDWAAAWVPNYAKAAREEQA